MNWKTDDLCEEILELFTENIYTRDELKEFSQFSGYHIEFEPCDDQKPAQ